MSERTKLGDAWATVEAAALARADLLDSNFAGGQSSTAAEIRDAVAKIAALLRAPRGEVEEEEADVVHHDLVCAIEIGKCDGSKMSEAAARHLELALRRIVREETAAALRSEAQGEEDAVRRTWELAVQRAYGCLDYCGGYRGAELKAFHSGIKTVIRALEAGLDTVDTQTAALDRIGAALRSEAQGDGPVGAVCANCGAPNAAIAGGELDPDEAFCSVECYEQLRELGCPQEHGGDYRPKPARRGEEE